jgi:hypothetical protein
MANQERISWLDYTIINNPNGVMKVLSDYGFTGYMTPNSEDEMKHSALEVMDLDGDEGIKAILKAHPEYPVFKDIFECKQNKFHNAVGGSLTDKINAFATKSPVNQVFIALAVFTIAYYIIDQIKK